MSQASTSININSNTEKHYLSILTVMLMLFLTCSSSRRSSNKGMLVIAVVIVVTVLLLVQLLSINIMIDRSNQLALTMKSMLIFTILMVGVPGVVLLILVLC